MFSNAFFFHVIETWVHVANGSGNNKVNLYTIDSCYYSNITPARIPGVFLFFLTLNLQDNPK